MIPTSLYDSYSTALNENDRQCRAALSAIISQLDPADVDGIRDAMLQTYPALVRTYGQRAAQVAVEFYMGVRSAQQVATSFDATLPYFDGDEELWGEVTRDVRREVDGLYKGTRTLPAFESVMQGLATKRTMGMADSTIQQLAQRDPAKPKWAFVPHPGACGWCVMIGSRGFDYTKQDTAENMRHDNCHCVTVADFDTENPVLEGYDPGALYEAYAAADDESLYRAEWDAMSPEERAKYVRKTKDPRTGKVKEYVGDWSTYRRNRTVQEMNVMLGHTKSTAIDKAAQSA